VVTETVIRLVLCADGVELELTPTFSEPCEPSSAVVFELGFDPTPSIAAAAAATAPIAPSAIAETTAWRIGRALCRGRAAGCSVARDAPAGFEAPGAADVGRAAMEEVA
jgi:hypothetical protein